MEQGFQASVWNRAVAAPPEADDMREELLEETDLDLSPGDSFFWYRFPACNGSENGIFYAFHECALSFHLPNAHALVMKRRLDAAWEATQKTGNSVYIICCVSKTNMIEGVAKMTSPPGTGKDLSSWSESYREQLRLTGSGNSFNVEWVLDWPVDKDFLEYLKNTAKYLHPSVPVDKIPPLYDTTHGEEVDPVVGKRAVNKLIKRAKEGGWNPIPPGQLSPRALPPPSGGGGRPPAPRAPPPPPAPRAPPPPPAPRAPPPLPPGPHPSAQGGHVNDPAGMVVAGMRMIVGPMLHEGLMNVHHGVASLEASLRDLKRDDQAPAVLSQLSQRDQAAKEELLSALKEQGQLIIGSLTEAQQSQGSQLMAEMAKGLASLPAPVDQSVLGRVESALGHVEGLPGALSNMQATLTNIHASLGRLEELFQNAVPLLVAQPAPLALPAPLEASSKRPRSTPTDEGAQPSKKGKPSGDAKPAAKTKGPSVTATEPAPEQPNASSDKAKAPSDKTKSSSDKTKSSSDKTKGPVDKTKSSDKTIPTEPPPPPPPPSAVRKKVKGTSKQGEAPASSPPEDGTAP